MKLEMSEFKPCMQTSNWEATIIDKDSGIYETITVTKEMHQSTTYAVMTSLIEQAKDRLLKRLP